MPEHLSVRLRATVHYDGSAFHGWQLQPDAPTVQQALEAALSRVLDVETRIEAAGRTDAGVHAAGQEIAFDAPARWTPSELRRAVNAVTPDEVWLEQLRPAPAGFHPRFDATGRRYEYLVGTAAETASPLRAGRIWQLAREVDDTALGDATRRIVGERTFAGLSKSGQPERGTRCRVEEARWERTAAGDLAFLVVADRFLHHMVRYLVHTLIEVGTRRRSVAEVEALLADHDAPPTPDQVRPPAPAPACGLYLTGVRYAEGWNRPRGVPGVPLAGETRAAAEIRPAGETPPAGRGAGRPRSAAHGD